jgi:nucleoside-diphosphate-sugar epimerase
MKVLVTGAGGFLGKSIVRSLLRSGVHDLRLQYRAREGRSALAALVAGVASAELCGANLLDRAALAGLLEGVDVVIHAAAGKKGAAADMYLNSVVTTRNLFEACRDARVRRVVLVSSFSVYDSSRLAAGAVFDESVPLEFPGVAKGPYGYAKAAQERVARSLAAQYGIELTVARPGVIFGPEDLSVSTRVGIAVAGMFVFLGGGAPLPLTWVENCADAIVLLALEAPAGTTVNVVDDDLPSCRAFMRRYRRSAGPLRVVPLPYPLLLWGSMFLVWYNRRSKGQMPAIFTPHIVRSMYRSLRYSNAALKQLGWKPRVAMPDALERMMQGFEARRAAQRPPALQVATTPATSR